MSTYQEDINLISQGSGLGSFSRASSDAMFGINHRGLGNPIPLNTDNQGMIFFTRPLLNLSYDNVAACRQLTPLLTPEEYSYQRAIRCLLDPWGHGPEDPSIRKAVNTPLIDPKQAFITPLTNHLLSLTGWPDQELDTFTSKPGAHREVFTMADGISRDFSAFPLNATYRNVTGDPITLLYYVWMKYIAEVTQGTMLPYPQFVLENEIDYMTRIYRLVLDPTRQYVQRITACAGAFPTANPLGAVFNFNADQAMSQDSKEISVRFQCVGYEPYEPILLMEFNATVCYFNRDMFDGTREEKMQRLTKAELTFFNYKGYPRIDPKSNRLEWWVTKLDYEDAKRRLLS